MEAIGNFKNGENTKKKQTRSSFLNNTISESKPYPIVNTQIKEAIKKYALVFKSPNNIAIPAQPFEKESNFQKKEVIKKQAIRKFPGMSFYNNDRTLRLSDHWNTGYHDQIENENFVPKENYVYVGKKVDYGTWKNN